MYVCKISTHGSLQVENHKVAYWTVQRKYHKPHSLYIHNTCEVHTTLIMLIRLVGESVQVMIIHFEARAATGTRWNVTTEIS